MRQSFVQLVGFLLTAVLLVFSQSTVADVNLPLGDINVVVLTDVHSWVGGHGQKEGFDADYGDVLSFYQRLQEQLDELRLSDPNKHQHDLWIVCNGDWIDGTGLALNGDPSFLIPILEKMPWDAINIGNHELYKRDVIDAVLRPGGFAEWFGPRYISANVLHTPTNSNEKAHEPVVNRYRLLKGKYANVLTFGFLFNMVANDPTVTVQTVQDTVKEDWFRKALTTETEMNGGFDAIMVLAHMDLKDDLVQVILDRIREYVPADFPVQFVTGHTHYRGYFKPDNFSSSFEAGKYLDTVGFVSFPKHSTIRNAALAAEKAAEAAEAAAAAAAAAAALDNTTLNENVTITTNETDAEEIPGSRLLANDNNGVSTVEYHDTFEHVFIDAKYDALAETLGLERNDLLTEDGMFLTDFIYKVQQDLGLYEIVGCIDRDYDVAKHPSDPTSLWNLYCNEVVPHVMPHRGEGNPKVVMTDSGAFRYSLYAKEVVKDEVIAVAPFNESFVRFEGITGSVLLDLNSTLNNHIPSIDKLPNFIMCPTSAPGYPQPGTPDGNITQYDLIVAKFAAQEIEEGLRQVWSDDDGTENRTTEGSASSVPEPIQMMRTELEVWFEFFDTTDLCTTKNKGTHKPKPPPKVDHKNPHQGTNTNKHHKSGNETDVSGGKFMGPGTFKNASTLDRFRMLFYGVAICVMLAFTVIYVRQRGRIYRREVTVREMATQEALDEFNEKHGISLRYRDSENGDGRPQSFNSEDDDLPLGFYDESRNQTPEAFMDEPTSGIFPEDSYGNNDGMADLDPEEPLQDAPPDLLS